jgi:hypothetical protein
MADYRSLFRSRPTLSIIATIRWSGYPGRRGRVEAPLRAHRECDQMSARKVAGRARAHPETPIVPSRPLDSTLSDEGFTPGFDLLVVDVEGREQALFSAFDLDGWRPKMLIVELGDTHPDLTTSRTSDYRLGRSLSASGYDVIYKDSINTVLARRYRRSGVRWHLCNRRSERVD